MPTNNPEPKSGTGGVGPVSFIDGGGELPMVEVNTARSTAGIYLHGAHVTHFKKKGQPPLLFLSQCSRFAENEPIRGGIPVILPWFGPREGLPQHGFARLKAWELKEFAPAADGSVSVRFRLPDCPEGSAFPPFSAEYLVTVSDTLTLQLIVKNLSSQDVFNFENCLHTYFEVGDINRVSIHGLQGAKYLDKVANFARKTETSDAIRITSEVDRTYLDTMSAVEITDPVLKRKIRVEKNGSASTVVWNPWVAKAQQMPDFGNEEYQRMVCVESGNVASNNIKLPPGETSTLTVKLSSEALGKFDDAFLATGVIAPLARQWLFGDIGRDFPWPFDKQRARGDNSGMNVTLPMPLEEFIRRKVAGGEFHSADEVVCEGLRLLQQREAWEAEARRKIDVGWEQAKSGQLRGPEELTQNLAARKEAWKRSQRG